jgi:CheY-like chemotaxis protein
MKPLLIHNENTYLLHDFHRKSWNSEKFTPNAKYDIDAQLTAFINDKIAQKAISAIFIKATLSKNYLEFIGLRLGIHLRLSVKNPEIQFLPLVFLCEDNLVELCKIYKFHNLLLSPGVYLVSECSSDIEVVLNKIDNKQLKGCDTIGPLIEQLKIDSPGNYDSHHSIANEWALFRYSSMFEQDGLNGNYIKLQKKLLCLDYLNTLHFKLTEAISARQNFKSKHNIKPTIKEIVSTEIGVVDDDIINGWLEFYTYVFEKSEANLNAFVDFQKDDSKNNLIVKIQKWLLCNFNSENPIDLFLIDLRLHEDDFIENKFEELSGIQIVKFIKKHNPGIQVVITSASNKVWNYQKCLDVGVKYYFVKESPDTFNTRVETIASYHSFSNQISLAVKDLFLAELFRNINYLKSNHIFLNNLNDEIREFVIQTFGPHGLLDQIFSLLLLDNSNEAIINQCLLVAFQILEKYCELKMIGDFGRDRDKGSSGFVWLKDDSKFQIYLSAKDFVSTRLELVTGHFDYQLDQYFEDNSHQTPISYILHKELVPRISDRSGLDSTFLIKMISVLSCREGIEKVDIERLINLRYYRSNVAAHLTGNVKSTHRISNIEISFFVSVFSKIFLKK